ncbi:MAG: ThiF family adenylyltransferase [Acidobacteria bacterium]|nr:ThiF family adenylyltransferase [Acidobacteriota bacterium]
MSNDELSRRYSRQILFSGIGDDGQRRLREARVVVVGAGALGAVQIETLARAGVGRLRIVDRDVVEMSNLHRQILYTERDAADGVPKAVAAERRVREINSEVDVEGFVEDVNAISAGRLLDDVDLVLDATDNFETRYLLNDAAARSGLPWIYGAVVGGGGATMTIRPGLTPCLRCLFETMPDPGSAPTCDTAGVALPAVAVIASVQSAEAIKLLCGRTELLHGGLLQFDVWENRWTRIGLDGLLERGNCPVCHQRKFEFLDAPGQHATTMCGRGAVQVTSGRTVRLDLGALAARLRPSGEVSENAYLVKFRSGEIEMTIFADARCIIKGVTEPSAARSLYARYVGT